MRSFRLCAAVLLLVVGSAVLSGSKVSKPAVAPAFGQLWEDGAGSVINLATAGVYYQWVSSTAGLSLLTVPSAGADNITVSLGGDGTYNVCISTSYNGSVNTEFHWATFLDGNKQSNVSNKRKIGAAADLGNTASCGLLSLVAGSVLDLRVTADVNTKSVTVNHASLVVHRVGP